MKPVWINGEPSDHISVMDRGLHYGDGLFETIRVNNGIVQLWSQHWQRLETGCEKLRIPVPDKTSLEQEIQQYSHDSSDVVIKLIITRGAGQRGYAFPSDGHPTRIMIMSPLSDYPESYRSTGVRVYCCETPLGLNPSLAGIKHLNRLEQVMARNEWPTDEYQEGIVSDIHGNMIEGTMTNLFWVKEGQLYTPELTASGVAGVMREIVIQLASKNNIPIKMGLWPVSELLNADEIFLTNSLIGIWPVSYILNRTFQAGPVTKQLQTRLQAEYAI